MSGSSKPGTRLRRPDPSPAGAAAGGAQRRRGSVLLLGALVAGAVLLVHWPVLSAEAVYFDDPEYFGRNPLVQNPSWASAGHFFAEVLEPSTVRGYYQPLSMISLMLDCAAGGRMTNLAPFHRTSLALHALNAVLVFVLFRQLFGSAPAAAGAALLFGLHPQTVESVAWVCQRKNLLAALFSLAALVAYLRYARTGGRGAYAGSVLLFLLALLAKPTSVPLPGLMLVLDFWPLRRLKAGGPGRVNWRAVWEKTPFFLLAGIFAVITYVSQGRTALVQAPGSYGLDATALLVLHNVAFYLLKFILPIQLSAHYPFPETLSLAHPMILAGVILTPLLLAGLLVSLRWTRVPLAAFLFFLLAILPAIGVIGFTNTIAGDRFMYLPSVGLLLPVAWALSRVRRTVPAASRSAGRGRWAVPTRRIWWVVPALFVLLAGWGTRAYLANWRDTDRLFEHLLRHSPQAAITLYPNLGHLLSELGRPQAAIEAYRAGVACPPDPSGYYASSARSGLAQLVGAGGDAAQAVALYREALALSRDSRGNWKNQGWFRVANDLAWHLATAGRAEVRNGPEAVRLAEQACEATAGRNADMLDTLAAAYAEAGRFDEAVAAAQRAVAQAERQHDPAKRADIAARLRLYQARQPFRSP